LKSSRIKVNNEKLSIRIPLNLTKNSKKIRVAWSSNITTSNLSEVLLENGIPAKNGGDFRWQDAIMYSLMVDRFKNADPSNDSPIINGRLADRVNFRGGDLQGVIEKLDENYFNDLGVNTLWILPIIKNTPKPFMETPPPHRMFSGYHGYWPISGREVDPLMGWTSSADTQAQVRLSFDTKVAALDYAKAQGIDAAVQEPKSRKVNVREGGYGENFATYRRGTWTH
jgi:hypothetical protein